MRAGWMLVLGGCFSPSAPSGAPCAPQGGDRCPPGQVCTLSGGVELCLENPDTLADARPDACETCTPSDRDGDGVLDEVDLCPDVADDQSDEDGDGVGDACDPCPPFAATGDQDGDGLPDACDPHPTTPGDVLRQFHGFRTELPAGWTAVNFAADGGDAVGTAPASGGATLTLPKPPGDLTVWVDATLTSLAGGLGALGVMTVSDAGVDDNVVCQLVGQSTGATQRLRIFDNGGAAGLVAEADHAFVPGLHAELRVSETKMATPILDCSATEPVVGISGPAAFTPSSPEIGLRVRSATARYHWLMVIESP